MSAVLYVGDPHARPEDLEDCQALVDFIVKTALEQRVARIVFLGDQFHTHAVVHVEVLAFWMRALGQIYNATKLPIVLLVGNHDQPGDASSQAHAMMGFEALRNVTVVDRPLCIDGILHLPYRHSSKQFVADCHDIAHKNLKAVVCHQTFNGAKYENGFFAKDGVNPEEVPQQCFLSGHIHDPQRFDKVIYLGASRWMTASDANSSRYLTVIDHGDDGLPKSFEVFPLDAAVRKIHHFVDTEDKPAPTDLDSRHRYIVDISGSLEWIEARRPLFVGRAQVRTQRTDRATVGVRESEGIAAALKRFVASYKATRGTPTDTLERLVNVRLTSPT